MEQTEAHYTKGFNSGYLLAKYEPSLLENMLKQVSPAGAYLEGFFSGKEEYELEQSRTQLNELSQLRDKDREQDRGLEL